MPTTLNDHQLFRKQDRIIPSDQNLVEASSDETTYGGKIKDSLSSFLHRHTLQV
jgi:hypothetical protein